MVKNYDKRLTNISKKFATIAAIVKVIYLICLLKEIKKIFTSTQLKEIVSVSGDLL